MRAFVKTAISTSIMAVARIFLAGIAAVICTGAPAQTWYHYTTIEAFKRIDGSLDYLPRKGTDNPVLHIEFSSSGGTVYWRFSNVADLDIKCLSLGARVLKFDDGMFSKAENARCIFDLAPGEQKRVTDSTHLKGALYTPSLWHIRFRFTHESEQRSFLTRYEAGSRIRWQEVPVPWGNAVKNQAEPRPPKRELKVVIPTSSPPAVPSGSKSKTETVGRDDLTRTPPESTEPQKEPDFWSGDTAEPATVEPAANNDFWSGDNIDATPVKPETDDRFWSGDSPELTPAQTIAEDSYWRGSDTQEPEDFWMGDTQEQIEHRKQEEAHRREMERIAREEQAELARIAREEREELARIAEEEEAARVAAMMAREEALARQHTGDSGEWSNPDAGVDWGGIANVLVDEINKGAQEIVELQREINEENRRNAENIRRTQEYEAAVRQEQAASRAATNEAITDRRAAARQEFEARRKAAAQKRQAAEQQRIAKRNERLMNTRIVASIPQIGLDPTRISVSTPPAPTDEPGKFATGCLAPEQHPGARHVMADRDNRCNPNTWTSANDGSGGSHHTSGNGSGTDGTGDGTRGGFGNGTGNGYGNGTGGGGTGGGSSDGGSSGGDSGNTGNKAEKYVWISGMRVESSRSWPTRQKAREYIEKTTASGMLYERCWDMFETPSVSDPVILGIEYTTRGENNWAEATTGGYCILRAHHGDSYKSMRWCPYEHPRQAGCAVRSAL